MLSVRQIIPLRKQIAEWRRDGQRIALVPTMGNLHQGHLALVEYARQIADRVAVTIFVNPSQFVAGEDYAGYPRTLQQDQHLLETAKTDLLFHPDAEEIYPGGSATHTMITVPALDNIYCGKFRPGHFAGVATVVSKLFNIVQPDVAIFGEKDYQQLLVIRQMARDLCFPVEIVGRPTVRESDGLAMSSRNAYLSAEERKQAPLLFEVLTQLADQIRNGETRYSEIEQQARTKLEQAGFSVDYVAVAEAENLDKPVIGDLIVLAAARLGAARLIDNILVKR